MSAAMALWRVLLIFEFIYVLLPSDVLPQNLNAVSENYSNKTCNLADGRDGLCVYAYLCKDSVINVDGAGMVDLRFSDDCEDYFLKCCSIETPCENNRGTCVAANRCDVDLNSSRYKIFRESDECEWNNYKCCPNEGIRMTDPVQVECDVDSICVPDAQCLVQPDGGDLINPRMADCEGHQTCCPRSQLRKSSSNPCEEIGGRCVRQGQCKSAFNLDIRSESCDEPDFECCMDSTAITVTPTPGKSCFRGSGTCIPRRECKATVYKDRDNECSGLVCCAGTTSTTTSKPVSPGKTCISGSGVCIPRNECRGTVYRDRNNECDGLVCCATFTPTVLTTTSTTTPRTSVGKACSNNRGKCTLKNECKGIVYRDRHNECDGLACCATQGTTHPTTPSRVTSTTTRSPVSPGKPCNGNRGKCTARQSCRGTVYREQEYECTGLVCCANTPPPTPPPLRTCSSMLGTCAPEQSCRRRSTNVAADCGASTVCCLEVEVKDCGYRNEHGIKFNTINRNDGESQYGEFPWMVAIMIEEEGVLKYSCGGSLIHPAVVLTSAECVKLYRRTVDRLEVRAGEWDMGSVMEPIPFHERRVMKISSHPSFQPNTLANNVALVFLEDEFDLGATVNTVCLPPQNFYIDNGEVTATGWGTTPQDRLNYQQILKSIDLPYTQRSDCERTLRKATTNKSFKLHSSFFCAGGQMGVDTCSGDAGSPMVYLIPDDPEFRYYAVGMVSWGVGCGRPGIPAVYTDVGKFRDWIDRTIEQEGLATSFYEYQTRPTSYDIH